MKVFVLITECVTDYVNNTQVENECRVFSTLEKAQEVMKKEYDAEFPDWEESHTDCEGKIHLENELISACAYICSEGRYDENHISWDIYEREIQ